MDSEGTRFKKARLDLGLTLQDLVLMTGYSISTISGVENEHDAPSKRLRKLLIERMDLNEDWLRTGRGSQFVDSARSSLAKIATDEAKQHSPEEQEIFKDQEFVGVINKLRLMPKPDRNRYLAAIGRLLDELHEQDRAAKGLKSKHEQSGDKIVRLMAQLFRENAEEFLSAKKEK